MVNIKNEVLEMFFSCFIMLFPNPDDDTPAILQKAEVEIVDQTVCHSTYGLITSRMLCAGIMSGKRDSCKVRISLFLACILATPPP